MIRRSKQTFGFQSSVLWKHFAFRIPGFQTVTTWRPELAYCGKSSFLRFIFKVDFNELHLVMTWGNSGLKTRSLSAPRQSSCLGLFAVLSAPLKWRAASPLVAGKKKSLCGRRAGSLLLKLQALNVLSQVRHLLLLSDFFFFERHLVGFLLGSPLLFRHRSRIEHIVLYKYFHVICCHRFSCCHIFLA